MAWGGGGGTSQAWARDGSPSPYTGQLHWQIALCGGGGGGRGEQLIELKNIDIKNTLLFLPPSLSIGADLVKGAVN